jgi:hypothetical protein
MPHRSVTEGGDPAPKDAAVFENSTACAIGLTPSGVASIASRFDPTALAVVG